ncbi:MAG: sorbose system component [Tepidanaerobacteraceae bacterium]|nr:sorbose system component [Tepidanaerobacteraceae bacterium]
MLNIVLTRIDDRLIHGQVMAAWSKFTKANRIMIIDDLVANDPFMGKILKMAAPPGMKVDVYNVKQATEILKNTHSSADRVIILAKYPKTIYELIEAGVEIKDLNVGGMAAGPGRKTLYKNISASAEEKEVFKDIISRGTYVYIKIIPDDKEVDIRKFLD